MDKATNFGCIGHRSELARSGEGGWLKECSTFIKWPLDVTVSSQRIHTIHTWPLKPHEPGCWTGSSQQTGQCVGDVFPLGDFTFTMLTSFFFEVTASKEPSPCLATAHLTICILYIHHISSTVRWVCLYQNCQNCFRTDVARWQLTRTRSLIGL